MTEHRPLVKPKQGSSTPKKQPDADVQLFSPSQVDRPTYLMCQPLSLDTSSPNNAFMLAMTPEELKVHHQLAMSQWLDLYDLVQADGNPVYLLPPRMGLQDQVYVANLAIILCHLPVAECVLAHFKSPPRVGEEEVGRVFFEECGYKVSRPPYTFDGTADLKHLRDNIYIGGYGIRTDERAYDWFEEKFDMKVIRVKMTDQKAYHLDCLVEPLTAECVVACPAIMEDADVKAVEKVCDVIPVSKRLAHAATTNFVRVGAQIVYGTNGALHDHTHDDFKNECDKKAFFEKLLPAYGMKPQAVNISEFEKSGAAVSCCVMSINLASFAVPLV